MNQFSQKELEIIFANNFASPLFPILANMYYNKKEYSRAQKVCEVGLSHNIKNYIGQYILSKIHFNKKEYSEAEKILNTIVENDTHNINALIKLVETQKLLKHSRDTIQGNINKGLSLKIEHKLFQKPQKIKKKATNTINQPNKNISDDVFLPKKSMKINTKMATKTMYSLMIKQKKYYIAKSILEIMRAKSKNTKFVNLEFKKIKKILSKREK